jgi:hypothetical protein
MSPFIAHQCKKTLSVWALGPGMLKQSIGTLVHQYVCLFLKSLKISYLISLYNEAQIILNTTKRVKMLHNQRA